MRTFSEQQANVLIDTLGVPLLLSTGTTITVVFESRTVAIQTDDGSFVETQESYLTTLSNSIGYGDTFTYKGKSQNVYNIIDDLSGIVDVYFRESST